MFPSGVLSKAAQEVKELKLNVKESMRKYDVAYANSRSLSLQEAVAYSHTCSPKTVFVNTCIPSQRVHMCKSIAEPNHDICVVRLSKKTLYIVDTLLSSF